MDSTLVFLCVLATVLSKGFAVVCEDDPTWTDSGGYSCADYVGFPDDCDLYPDSKEACLLTCNICEIDPEPSPTPTATTSTTTSSGRPLRPVNSWSSSGTSNFEVPCLLSFLLSLSLLLLLP